MIKNFMENFRPYYDNFMKDLDGLLRIPSVLDEYKENSDAPFGKGNKDALMYMLSLGEKDGFKAVNVDNYGGFLEYGEGDKVLLILCHLDVVPTTGNWTNPPFEPVIKDGRIYARGSSDDKGPLMATYYALKMLKDNGYEPSMRVRFFFGCDEESGSRCLERYIEKYGECDYGFSPDAGFPCIFAEKGISSEMFSGKTKDSNLVSFNSGTVSNVVPDVAVSEIENLNLEKEFNEYLKENNLKGEVNGNLYTIYGKAAHGSIPETGINAALYLGRFLYKYIDNEFLALVASEFDDFYGDNLGIGYIDSEMGRISNNIAIFKFKDNEYKIVTNIRYPKGFDFELKMKELEKHLLKFGAALTVLSNSNYHYVPKYSHLVQALLKAYRDSTGDLTEPFSIGGGTYARDFKNAVAFGVIFPGETESMHMPDESASIENLIKSSYIILEAIKNICD